MTWDSKSFATSIHQNELKGCLRWLNSGKFWRRILMISGTFPVTSLSSCTPNFRKVRKNHTWIIWISTKCWPCSLSENLVFTEHKMVDRKHFFARQLFRWARCHTKKIYHHDVNTQSMSSPLMHWCWFSFTNYLVHQFGISDHQKPWNIRIDIGVNRTYLSWIVKDQWWNITISININGVF